MMADFLNWDQYSDFVVVYKNVLQWTIIILNFQDIEDYAHPVGRRIPKIVEKFDQGNGLGEQDKTQPVAKNVQAIENLVKAYQILRKQVEYLQNMTMVHRTGTNSSVDNIPPIYQPRPRQKLDEFFRQLRQKCRVNSPELNTPYCKLFSFWLWLC